MTVGSRRRSNSSTAIKTRAISSVREKLGEPPPPAAEAAAEPADPPEVGAWPGGATDDTWLLGGGRAATASVLAPPVDPGASRAAIASWGSEASAKGVHSWTSDVSPVVGRTTGLSGHARAGALLVRGVGRVGVFPPPFAAAVVTAVG